MDVAYINPFIAATREVLSTMVHVPVTPGSPHLCEAGDRGERLYQLSAVIGLKGAISGFAVLSVSRPTAEALVKGLLGELPAGDDEILAACFDALGEVTNMICGGAKKNFPGGLVQLSTPKLTATKELNYPERIPIIGIPFDAGVGRLSVTISFKHTAAA
jgi:chemotaxis protein CheX